MHSTCIFSFWLSCRSAFSRADLTSNFNHSLHVVASGTLGVADSRVRGQTELTATFSGGGVWSSKPCRVCCVVIFSSPIGNLNLSFIVSAAVVASPQVSRQLATWTYLPMVASLQVSTQLATWTSLPRVASLQVSTPEEPDVCPSSVTAGAVVQR